MNWKTLDQSFETMSQAEALEIVQQEATDLGLPMLETMTWMSDNYEELDSVQKNAFRTAFRGFQRLLAPVTE
jgi:hypothetical protein